MLRRALLALLAIVLAYLIAAAVGSLVPRNSGWDEPRQGVVIFVRTNGVHADIVLPASAAGLDLYRLVPPADVREPRRAGGWVTFGWGQREFYLETPRWADLTVENAIRSVIGGEALMHIEHLGQPRISPETRAIRLDPEAYRRLVASIERYFVLDQSRRTIPLLGRGYGPNAYSTRRAADTARSRPPISGPRTGSQRPASRRGSGRPSRRESCGATATNRDAIRAS